MAEIRIGELARQTGVSKETIHFYLREGLIPRPRKTSRNMAYYDEAHVRHIQAIKRLQTEKFLPLSVIKRFLKSGRGASGRGVDRLLQDVELVSELLSITGAEALTRIPAAQVIARAGSTPALLTAVRNAGIIEPEHDATGELYRHEDVEIVRLVQALEGDAGFSREAALELAELYARNVEPLVRHEVRMILGRFLEGEPPAETVEALRRGRGVTARLLSAVRSRALQREIENHFEQVEIAITGSARLVTGALGPAALAGTSFTALEEELRTALRRKRSAARRVYRKLVELYAGVGQFEAAAASAQAALRRFPGDPILLRGAGAALFELGQVDAAIERLGRACRRRPEDALALAYLGSAYLRRARDGAPTLGAAALAEAGAGISALSRSRSVPEPARSDALRTALVRGRVYGILPEFFGMFDEGLSELRWVIDQTERPRPEDEPLRESGELLWLRANADLLLSQLLGARGERGKARDHATKAAAADPDGQLRRRATKALAWLDGRGAGESTRPRAAKRGSNDGARRRVKKRGAR